MVRGLKIIRGKFALRFCGVQAVFSLPVGRLKSMSRETELFNNSAITALGSIHESL